MKFIIEIENEHLAVHEKVDKASGVHKPEGIFMSSRACSPAKNTSAGCSLDFSGFKGHCLTSGKKHSQVYEARSSLFSPIKPHHKTLIKLNLKENYMI